MLNFTRFLFIFAALGSGCGDTTHQPSSVEAKAPPSVPAAAQATAAPAPALPPPDFQEARRFSPDTYADLLERLIPVDKTLQQAQEAFIETRLAALEKDLIDDDWFFREGAVVLLGSENGMIVGLTYRYLTDITYPDIKLIGDGMGQADIVEQHLDLLSSRTACGGTPQPSCRQHRLRIVPKQAEQRVRDAVQALSFDDHDITLLYFHPDTPIIADRKTMNIERPTAMVRDHVRNAERSFGLQFTLISKEAFQVMKDHIKVERTGDKLLVSAVTMGMNPVVAMVAARARFLLL